MDSRDKERNQFILCFWRSQICALWEDCLPAVPNHTHWERSGNYHFGERCADLKWPDKDQSESWGCLKTAQRQKEDFEFPWILTYQVKCLTVLVLRLRHVEPLDYMKHKSYQWTCTQNDCGWVAKSLSFFENQLKMRWHEDHDLCVWLEIRVIAG